MSNNSERERRIKRLKRDRIAEMIARMEQGDECPIDEEWFVDARPLPESERRRLKGEFVNIHHRRPPLRCMAPVSPPCGERPINSHSIQRSGPLAAIADEGHVMVLRYAQSIEQKADTYMERVGIRDATTFPGLCALHDREIFRPIDVGSLTTPTSEQLFLLSYRSVLQALYTSRWMSQHRAAMLESIQDKDVPTSILELYTALALRAELIVPRLQLIADLYGRLYQDQDWTRIGAITGRNLPILPFAASNYFEPCHDHQGVPIDDDQTLFVTVNVVPALDGSIVALSFLHEQRDALNPFLCPLLHPQGPNDFIDTVWQMVLRYCDNVVVQPSHWMDRISEDRRQRIIRFCQNTRGKAWVSVPTSSISLFEADAPG